MASSTQHNGPAYDHDLSAEVLNQYSTKALRDIPEPEVGFIPLKALNSEGFNCLFLKRAYRILALGLGSPCQNPGMWLLVLVNFGFQITSAYMIQTVLYILATGKDNAYPGLAGCLKNGCGYSGSGKNATLIKAPGSPALVMAYRNDFAWMFILCMLLLLGFSITSEYLNTKMRRNSSMHIQTRLLRSPNLLYRLTVNGTMDGIDQRMTSDLQVVIDGFDCVLFGNLNDYLAYPLIFTIGRMAFSFSNVFNLPEMVSSPERQTQVFFIVFASVVIAIIAYLIPMNHVSRIFYRGQKYEGDFRTTHTKMVLCCEPIVTMGGEATERVLADQQFERVDQNNKLYYLWQSALMILRLEVAITIPAVSYVCLACSTVSNSTTANYFQKQVGDVLEYFLYLPAMTERLAYAAGASHRVGQLLEQMDRFEASPVATNFEHVDDKIILVDVNANPPIPEQEHERGCCGSLTSSEAKNDERDKVNSIFAKRPLFQGVNLTIQKGQSVCIVGPSGCGKSSLLRVIGGLWGITGGAVKKPSKVGKDGVFFLPQRPYVFLGGLHAQICYPACPKGEACPEGDDSDKVKQILATVHLSHLLTKYGLTTSQDWASVLSISEMQRLNFARMFFQRPFFCLADECTSALELRLESLLYSKCAEYGITMVSVAHRPTVIPHHQFVYKYVPASHSWIVIPASEVATCEKFPIEGFEESTTTNTEEPPARELKPGGFNLQFFRRLCNAFRLAIRRCGSQVWYLSFIMFIAMLIYGALTVIIYRDYGTGKIINQVTGADKKIPKDIQLAFKNAGIIIGLNTIIALVQSLSALCGAWIAMKMHRAIVNKFHSSYFATGVMYHLNRIAKEPGIDQRVVQDLAGWRESLAWLMGNPFAYFNYRVGLLPLTVTWFILLGYSLSTSVPLTVFFLIWIVFAYILQMAVAPFTTTAVEKRQAIEGDLRLHLGRVLTNIESITFFKGQEQEANTTDRLLEDVVQARYSYIFRASFTAIPTITMYYWLQTGVYVMAAMLQFELNGKFKLPSADLFTTIAFNIIWAKVTQLIIQCMGGFGSIAGFTHRVMEIVEKVVISAEEIEATMNAIKKDDNQISFSNVNVIVPTLPNDVGKIDKRPTKTAPIGKNNDVGVPMDLDAKVLVDSLTLSIPKGQHTCISGSGKTSVLRTLRGLWQPNGGEVSRPTYGMGLFALPQQSYATAGSLATQVVYPKRLSEVDASEQVIAGILNEVGLGAILSRWGLHTTADWDVVLSGGELQRLSFARLLFNSPEFAVMDESTSALDLEIEARCMRAIQKRNMTMLSVATRPSMLAYHQKKLHIDEEGKWELTDIQSSQL